MRMLVYMVGTMHDKYEYLGEESCNAMERSLIPLMGYGSFRFFSPVMESLDGWYNESREGYEAMKALAGEAGDTYLLHLMRAGRFSGRVLRRKICKRIACFEELFKLIYGKICQASNQYAKRQYPAGMEKDIQDKRDKIHAALLRAGYAGEYPAYKKAGSEILVFEEHPFTVGEMDNMEFSLRLLEHMRGDKRHPFRIAMAGEREEKPYV